MADMSAQEQLMLELTNRARMDPAGEAKRFGIALNEGVASGDTISSAPKQILAGNDDIAQAADAHSAWMLAHDVFSHSETESTSGFTGVNPGDRMETAGYIFSGSFASGENIAVKGTSGALTNAMLTSFIIEQHKDLFVDEGIEGRGHRLNILSDLFSEMGVGQKAGAFDFGSATFNSSMVTQDYARSGLSLFVTGVVYKDTVIKDDFFSVGEQIAGRGVAGGGESDNTGAGGGYELAFDSGAARTIAFSLGTGKVSVQLGAFDENVKLDVVNGNEVWTNGDVAGVSANVRQIHALGIAAVDLVGGSGNQSLFGNRAANALNGKDGADTLDGGDGKDLLTGGGGADQFVFAKGDSGATAATADVISDFSDVDRIILEAIDANQGKSGDQDFSFIGAAAFHDKAGELRIATSGGDTLIQGDVNGDGRADLMIRLLGKHSLTAADFDL
jgi:Ca2+-binding RTX toxin-like protein